MTAFTSSIAKFIKKCIDQINITCSKYQLILNKDLV